MSVIKHNEKEVELLARLMRAEAESEGELGMLMVGNVVINRALANCLDFKDVRTIEDVCEPFLLQAGLLQRTPRGRKVSPATYRHLGYKTTNSNQQSLF